MENTNQNSIKQKQALSLLQQGKLQAAEKLYQEIISAGSANHSTFNHLGLSQFRKGDCKAAISSFKEALKLNPKYSEAHSNLGMVLTTNGPKKDAMFSLKKAIKLNPTSPEIHYNLGNFFLKYGNLQSANLSFQKAINLKPNFTEAHYNLGIVLKKLGKSQSSNLSFQKTINLNPNYPKAHQAIGLNFIDQGNINAAISSFQKALKLQPSFHECRFNLSTAQLLSGNYSSGLGNLEWRWRRKSPPKIHGRPTVQPWVRKKLQKGEKLLVVSEQGLGDIFQYMRYIPYIKSQGIDVSFCTLPKLHTLIKASGIDQNPLTPEQANTVSEGQWIPLISLARYLQISPENPIISEPYISSTDELVKKWKTIFSKEKRPIVGLCWQGSPEMEKHSYIGRSIPLETFSMLLELNKITILSLQKGFGSEQLENCSFKNQFIACQPQIDSTWDFLETAAIIENCDLIITCDTSIAHLAGGMGKPVWLLLRNIPFWTWGLQSESTFWYPSMKLFRQKERHNWQEVMERVSKKLLKITED